MNAQNNLLQARFHLNMGRINALVKLIFSDIDPLKSTKLFQSDGARADILRTLVVFLHATFEDVLRSHLPKPNKKLCFSSGENLDKALKLSGIDVRSFKWVYPPLIQLAKRRNRIVHNADLPNRTDIVLEPWKIADEWQLIMWLMAVPTFYYQLRISLNVANVVEVAKYERLRKAMYSHVDFGNQLLSFSKVPSAIRIETLQKIINTLETIIPTLNLNISDIIVNVPTGNKATDKQN